MPLVTLIGETLAVEGMEFRYLGANNECRNCKLKTVCFNLKPGRRYKITKIRDKQHSCNVHEGRVIVVEVTELPITTTVSKKHSSGDRIKAEKQECNNIGCDFFELCTNNALQKDRTYTVKKIDEKIDCPAGYTLYKADLVD